MQQRCTRIPWTAQLVDGIGRVKSRHLLSGLEASNRGVIVALHLKCFANERLATRVTRCAEGAKVELGVVLCSWYIKEHSRSVPYLHGSEESAQRD